MKLTKTDGGYVMTLMAEDTTAWANKPGAVWPSSKLAGRMVQFAVDDRGLMDEVGVMDASQSEIVACVSDHLPADLRHLWPTWEPAKA